MALDMALNCTCTPTLNVMTVTEQLLNEGQKLIYGRRRIVSSFYEMDPDKYKDLKATDIDSIVLVDEFVNCQLQDVTLCIPRKNVINNFWEHRTRTPSYFDYKIWGQMMSDKPWNGMPIGAIDYTDSFERQALEPHLGRPPRIAVDKHGVQRVYYVMDDEQMCSCDSWASLNLHRKELEKEFKQFSEFTFTPICKHLQWSSSNRVMQALRFHANDAMQKGRRYCVYHFDHSHGIIRYRITNDGIRTNVQWLPAGGWKERQVYDSEGNPTGECWTMFTNALSQDPPYRLVPYNQVLANLMTSTSKN